MTKFEFNIFVKNIEDISKNKYNMSTRKSFEVSFSKYKRSILYIELMS